MSGPISAAPAGGDDSEGQQPSRDNRDSAENNDDEPTRLACSECRRRKQRCNKTWPCRHCSARGIEGECNFVSILDVEPTEESRARIAEATNGVAFSTAISEEVNNGDNDEPRLEQLGYSHALVDHFLKVVNNHPYILHPTAFKREYEQWRDDRDNQRPVGSQWTSLLFMVCACAARRSDDALRGALEADQGRAIHDLSVAYHHASHSLYLASYRARRDLHSLQQALLSCFWYQSEDRHSECRSSLDHAFYVIKELGIHSEAMAPPTSDYETEMRRRAWAIFRVWDWQMVDRLQQSPIVQPGEYDDVQLPGFQLDGDLKEFHPSPGLCVALQWKLMRGLGNKFGWPCTLDTHRKVVEHKEMVEQWIQRLPPYLAVDNPDTSLYYSCPLFYWQQCSLSVMSQSMVWKGLRPYLVKSLSSSSHVAELQLKHYGVDYSFKYLTRLLQYLKFVFPNDTSRLHTMIFFIFDVAAVMCSTLLHENDLCEQLRGTCLGTIALSVGVLKTLYPYAPVAGQAHGILNRIYEKVHWEFFKQVVHRMKRQRTGAAPSGASPFQTPYASARNGVRYFRSYLGIPESDVLPQPQVSGVIPPPPANNRAASVPSLTHVAHARETVSAGMQVGGPFDMPQWDDGDAGLADLPCLSSSATDVDENDLVSTPVDMSEAVEFLSDVVSPTEDDVVIMMGSWDYSLINLDPESLFPL
ncbi:fungal specific transcription factor [Trichoderma arundinaceum]|uniref:Fungal specific transcription factor n=1 Tax=Trichoderma arundinaceum TaxID=490622 RepID=A0A395NSY3_TRIAR|nr:fungal specific transcription factor [Trichoderma arundinaceum]